MGLQGPQSTRMVLCMTRSRTGRIHDSKSIMLYPIPRGHANIEVSWNTALSAGDKEYIGRVYPKQKP